MKNKSIIEELNKKQTAMNKELEELEAQIEKDKAEISTAENAMNTATDAGNVTDYKTAKANKQNAADALEMHQKRLEKMTGAPVISEQEYNKYIDDLTAEMDSKTEEIRKKAIEITDQLRPLQTELETEARDTNAAMKTAFKMAFPGHEPKNAAGSYVIAKDYRRHYDLHNWLTKAIGNEAEKERKRVF